MNKRKFLTAGSIVVLVVGLMAGAMGTVLAVHDAGLFELDTTSTVAVCSPLPAPCGDANTVNSAAAGDDWDNIYKSFTGLGTATADHAVARTFITDPVSGAENSFFTGGGSKDVNDIPQWAYGTSNDVVPDKDDIANAFAAAYVDPADNHTIIYFGMDRYDNNGDSETGFWFFKNTVSLNANGTFNGVHSVGDVLVLADWGGSNPVGDITVYKWAGGKNPLLLVADNAAADCAVVGANDNFCAVVNRQTDDPQWPFTDKAGSTDIRPLELFEAGLDINALLGSDQCFSSFLAATRSSHSTTAQLKDLALGGFEQCTPTLTTTPSPGANGTVTPGTSVTDLLVVQGAGLTNPPTPTGTATFFLCGPIASGTCSTGGTNIGTGTLASTAPPPGEASATSPAVNTAASPLTPGRYCFRSEWPGDTNYKPVAPATKFIEFGTGNSECFNVSKLPSTTVTTSLPTGGGVIPGTSVSDSATVSGPAGQPTPTGSVKFFLCQPAEVTAGGCEGTAGTQIGTPAAGETLDASGVAASESTSNTTAIGTYCWRAEYSGDTIYNASSHTNITTECFTTLKQPSSTVTTSTPTGGSVVPGTSVSDSATVSGGVGQPVPIGTVKFFLCQPIEVTVGGCEGTAGTQIGTPLVGETLNAAGVATSEASTNTTAIGKYCWRAEYSGDSFYDPSSHTNTTTECFTTVKQPSTTVTTSSPTGTGVFPGTSVSDSATVSGGAGQPVPTGTVKFFLCQPAEVTAGGCEGTAGTQIGTPLVGETLNGSGVAGSESTTNTNALGKYCWRAEYSGDDFYNPSSHTNTTSECFTVSDTSTTTSAQTWMPNDSATVTSDHGAKIGGTLSFTLYAGGSCSGTVLRSAETFTLSGANSTETRTTTNSTVSVSTSSTVSWWVVFTSTITGVASSSHCESTQLIIAN